MKQQAMQAQQQEAQNNPAMMKMHIDMEKLKMEAQKNQAQFEVDMTKIEAEKLKVHAQVHMNEINASVGLVRARTEKSVHEIDAHLKQHDQEHRHMKEAIEVHHKGLETYHKISQKGKEHGKTNVE